MKSRTDSDPSGIGEVYTPFGGSIPTSIVPKDVVICLDAVQCNVEGPTCDAVDPSTELVHGWSAIFAGVASLRYDSTLIKAAN